MDKYVYNLVKQQQQNLSADEQFECAHEIQKSCNRIISLCWLIPSTKEIILDTLQRTNTLSKLGRDYNPSIEGHNQSIHERIKRIRKELESANNLDGVRLLTKANLHPRIVLNEYVTAALEAENKVGYVKSVYEELAALKHNRELLVTCVLEAAAEIALIRHRRLNSDIISETDLFQEAVIAAHEGTLLYNPISNAKWSSFVYSRMYNRLSVFITEKFRVVPIPRYISDKYSQVINAIQETRSVDTEVLTSYLNNTQASVSESEVKTLLDAKQAIISLDFKVNEDDSDESPPLLDIITADEDAENNINHEMFLKRDFIRVLKEQLSELEYSIIKMLWGLESCVQKDVNEVYMELKNMYPNKKISKLRIKRIAEGVVEYLNGNEELKEAWLSGS